MWGLDLKPGYVALNETGLWDIYGVYIFSSYGAYISSSNQNRRCISALVHHPIRVAVASVLWLSTIYRFETCFCEIYVTTQKR